MAIEPKRVSRIAKWLSWREGFETSERDDTPAFPSFRSKSAYNLPVFEGSSPLIWAIEQGLVDYVFELLARGASPNQADLNGHLPLAAAAAKGSLPAVARLLEAGADVNRVDASGRTALMFAAFFGHLEIVQHLVKTGARKDIVDVNGRTLRDFVFHPYGDAKPMKEIEAILQTRGRTGRGPSSDRGVANLDPVSARLLALSQSQSSLVGATLVRALVVLALTFVLPLIALFIFWGNVNWVYLADFAVGLFAIAALELFVIFKCARFFTNSFAGIFSKERSYAAMLPASLAEMTLSEGAQSASHGLEEVSGLLKLGSRVLHRRGSRVPEPTAFRDSVGRTLAILVIASAHVGGLVLFCVAAGLISDHLKLSFAYLLLTAVMLSLAVSAVYTILISLLVRIDRRAVMTRRYAVSGQFSKVVTAPEAFEPSGAEPYLLYLRAFTQDGFQMRNGENFETMMVMALGERAPIVAVGSPSDALGAARVSVSDEAWRVVVERLAEGAANILLIPHCSEGVEWEVNLLKDRGYLEKTILIMPPSWGVPGTQMADRWAELLSDPGFGAFEIPPYNPRGGLFRLNARARMCDWGAIGIEPSPFDIAFEGLSRLTSVVFTSEMHNNLVEHTDAMSDPLGSDMERELDVTPSYFRAVDPEPSNGGDDGDGGDWD